jgi:NAD(P)-dependent dehydrogenase (short-subunit alcohol dehydrogenase family)
MTQQPDMAGKTIVLTGATSGIGRATAVALAELGARMILLGRNPGRCEETLGEIKERTGRTDMELIRCDLASLAGIREAADAILAATDTIHVLLNNAGVTMTSRSVTADGYETTFAVNHLAYFALTSHLLPALQRGAPARIVNVSSDAHRFIGGIDLEDLNNEKSYSAMRVYGQSKTCNIHFTRELARRLEGTGITVNALHPGGIRSNLGGGEGGPILGAVRSVVNLFLKSADEGARTPVFLATDPSVEGTTGGYYTKARAAEPKAHALDADTAGRLWAISEGLCGIERYGT